MQKSENVAKKTEGARRQDQLCQTIEHLRSLYHRAYAETGTEKAAQQVNESLQEVLDAVLQFYGTNEVRKALELPNFLDISCLGEDDDD